MITNEQRLFQIEQQQRKLVDSVLKKDDDNVVDESDSKIPDVGTDSTSASAEDLEPLYPVLPNYSTIFY